MDDDEQAPYRTWVQPWDDPETGTRWMLRFHWALIEGRATLVGFGMTTVPHRSVDLNWEPDVWETHKADLWDVQPARLTASALRRVALDSEAHAARERAFEFGVKLGERHQRMYPTGGGGKGVSRLVEAQELLDPTGDGKSRHEGPGRPPVWGEKELTRAAEAYRKAQAEGLPLTATVQDALTGLRPDREISKRTAEGVIRKARQRGYLPRGGRK